MSGIILLNGNCFDASLVGGKALQLNRLINYGYTVPTGFILSPDIFNANNYMSEVIKTFDDQNFNIAAIRSSAVCEDGRNKSYAEQFSSYLGVTRDYLEDNILLCNNSSKNERLTQYSGISEHKLAIIIQEMVFADFSGVCFSKNPINGNNEVLIEVIEGLGPLQLSDERRYENPIVLQSDYLNDMSLFM